MQNKCLLKQNFKQQKQNDCIIKQNLKQEKQNECYIKQNLNIKMTLFAVNVFVFFLSIVFIR